MKEQGMSTINDENIMKYSGHNVSNETFKHEGDIESVVAKPSEDLWISEGKVQVRVHHGARRELYIPLRVAGSPPARAIFSCRITTGAYVNTGKAFQIVDSWTNRNTAHRVLSQPWTGKTEFIFKPDKENRLSRCVRP